MLAKITQAAVIVAQQVAHPTTGTSHHQLAKVPGTSVADFKQL